MQRPFACLKQFKIHRPLPLTPRESAQLLNVLTTSFRQQLDREHGILGPKASRTGEAPTGLHTAKPATDNADVGGRHIRPPIRPPTDSHIRSVLSNPLFVYQSNEKDVAARQPRSPRDPMKVFDEACAKGLMQLKYATACLKAKKEKIRRSKVHSVRDAMKSSQAGSKVLRWLLSSGIANDGAFLRDETFMPILIEFLVFENLQPVVWTWLEDLFVKISTKPVQAAAETLPRTANSILFWLINSEAKGYVSLDTAFSSLAVAKEYLARMPSVPSSVLTRGGTFLCKEVMFYSPNHPSPSPAAFDAFLRLVPSFTRHYESYLPHLLLNHPTKPDATLALGFLRMVKTWRRLPGPHSTTSTQGTRDRLVMSLALDTAKHLLEQDRPMEAEWVMTFIQENFASLIGLAHGEQRLKVIQAEAEASSIKALENLNLA